MSRVWGDHGPRPPLDPPLGVDAYAIKSASAVRCDIVLSIIICYRAHLSTDDFLKALIHRPIPHVAGRLNDLAAVGELERTFQGYFDSDRSLRRPRPSRRGKKFIRQIEYVLRWRGTVVERRSLAGELSLSCARPAADG